MYIFPLILEISSFSNGAEVVLWYIGLPLNLNLPPGFLFPDMSGYKLVLFYFSRILPIFIPIEFSKHIHKGNKISDSHQCKSQ